MKRPTFALCLLLLPLVISLLAVGQIGVEARERSSSSGFHQGSTREEVLANFARRKKQLEALLVESRQQLADHASGKKALGEKDLKSLEEKARAFQRKLETMEGDMDERELQRILKREGLRRERDDERRRKRERTEEL